MKKNRKEPEWSPFTCDFGKNWINKEGKLLSTIWFKNTGRLYDDEWTCVQKTDDEWNYINVKGEFLLAEWYRLAFHFTKDNYAVVQLPNGDVNYIDRKGNIRFPHLKKLTYCSEFKNGFALVYDENRLANLINEKGEYISDTWYLDINRLADKKTFIVYKGDRNHANIMDEHGNLILERWYYGIVTTDYSSDGEPFVYNSEKNELIIRL